jgi:UrcA family protein
MTRRIRSATLIFSVVLSASVPFAAGYAQTSSTRVHSFDLDLASQAGQAEMQRRIHHAVEQVCGPSGGVTMDDRMAYLSCSKTAEDGAISHFQRMVAAAREGKVANLGPDVIVR